MARKHKWVVSETGSGYCDRCKLKTRLKKLPKVEVPLSHFFVDGAWVREQPRCTGEGDAP